MKLSANLICQAIDNNALARKAATILASTRLDQDGYNWVDHRRNRYSDASYTSRIGEEIRGFVSGLFPRHENSVANDIFGILTDDIDWDAIGDHYMAAAIRDHD